MARHRGKAKHPATIGGGVLLVAALGVGAAYAAMTGGLAASPSAGRGATSTSSAASSSGDRSATGSSSSATSGTSASPASPATSTSTSASGPASPTSTMPGAGAATSTDAVAVAALASCTAMVRAQQGLATAVAASARDWGLHTDAQRKYDAGEFTVAQTKAQWAASKARGPADLAAFDRASRAVTAARGGCDGLAVVTSESSVEVPAKRCVARSAALARVVRTGTVVHQQWADHLVMMGHKKHMGATAYLDQWAAMVRASGPALTAYRRDAAALAKAPACRS